MTARNMLDTPIDEWCPLWAYGVCGHVCDHMCDDDKKPMVERDSRSNKVDSGIENGPRDGVSAPSQSRGLTDCKGVG